jgi:class 3 adenylate cyclase
MGTLFLQESDATVFLADIREFSKLASKRGATIELAITLSRFYEHIASVAKAEGGRVIKLCGDGVLCAFVGIADHRQHALKALQKSVATRDSMNDIARAGNMPVIDYTTVIGSGRVLAGDLGAEKLQGFDVIGPVVNRLFHLSQIATQRGVTHLIEASTFDAIPAADRPAARAAAPYEAMSGDGQPLALYELVG